MITEAQKQFAREHGITMVRPGPTFHVPWGFQHGGHNKFAEETEQDALTYLARYVLPLPCPRTQRKKGGK
jgi:hypothetical protein